MKNTTFHGVVTASVETMTEFSIRHYTERLKVVTDPKAKAFLKSELQRLNPRKNNNSVHTGLVSKRKAARLN
jgi:hypothetical protein